MFRQLRILILLLILLGLGISTWRTRSYLQSWTSTVHVAVFPINADGSAASRDYIAALTNDSFKPVEQYIEQEALRYGIQTLRPLSIKLGPQMTSPPPARPEQAGVLDAIRWSLSLRYWAWRNTPPMEIRPDLRLYLLYFDPAVTHRVPDSAGLEKGQIGVAHLFATRQANGSNLVVVTHEMLHTLGATDKYHLRTGLPLFPIGFADPQRRPPYPQETAEIMAGRIPRSETQADIPGSLAETLIGRLTAAEIGWIK